MNPFDNTTANIANLDVMTDIHDKFATLARPKRRSLKKVFRDSKYINSYGKMRFTKALLKALDGPRHKTRFN